VRRGCLRHLKFSASATRQRLVHRSRGCHAQQLTVRGNRLISVSSRDLDSVVHRNHQTFDRVIAVVSDYSLTRLSAVFSVVHACRPCILGLVPSQPSLLRHFSLVGSPLSADKVPLALVPTDCWLSNCQITKRLRAAVNTILRPAALWLDRA
jgi:hypothetical protein